MSGERSKDAAKGACEGMFGAGETIAASASSWRVVPSVKQVRGHLLVSLQEALRARGLHARYREIAGDIGAEALFSMAASSWQDIALAVQSDRALAELQLCDEELTAIGGEVSERAFGVIQSTLMRLSGHAGADAATALRLAPRIFRRMMVGGGVGVFRDGQRTLRYETWNRPLATSRVNRMLSRGSLQASLRRVSPQTAVTEAGVRQSPPSFAMRIQY